MAQGVVYFLDGLSVLRPALAGGNGVATSTGSTIFDVNGNPISAGNPLQVQDVAAEAAVAQVAITNAAAAVALGTPADAPYTGTGNATVVSALKAIDLTLAGGIPISAGAVKILDAGGVNEAVVNGSGKLSVTDAAAEASLATIATNTTGAQGTATGAFNPPSGGSGLLGYLSGIWALLQGTLAVAIEAGTNAIGTVALTAGSAVIGGVTQSGNWVLSAGSALIGAVTSLPTSAAATFTNVSVTTGTSLFTAGTATKWLDIQNLSTTTNMTLIAGGVTIRILVPLGTYTREGSAIPSNAITATSASGTITAAVGIL